LAEPDLRTEANGAARVSKLRSSLDRNGAGWQAGELLVAVLTFS
jgi:hypothetical protein